MSDESAPSPESSSNPPAEGTPRVRRISNPRPKKAAKAPRSPDDAADAPVSGPSVESPKPSKFPEFPASPDRQEEPLPRGDWPEPEAASSGASSSPENPKRKRRRKKGKGNNPQNAVSPNDSESTGEPSEQPSPQAAPQGPPQRPNHPPRQKPDSELLAKFAWKIYLSEVSEEGVALVGDNDAKELSRRCFRLAEIFLEEQARRR